MSQMGIESVLAQIRAIAAQTQAPAALDKRPPGITLGGGPGATAPSGSTPSTFAQVLRKGIEQVDQSQHKAAALTDAFERGKPGVDLPQVMLQVEKASVSFRALTEVRNRLISAYQDIMNMQL